MQLFQFFIQFCNGEVLQSDTRNRYDNNSQPKISNKLDQLKKIAIELPK